MPNLNSIYNQLLASPSVTETIQRRAVEVFCSTRKGDSYLAEAIFQSANLPAELADRVCAHGGPKELALWLALEGRTKEEITAHLKKEKRVTVLASVADRADLPRGVYENLIKASRNPKVLIRLISNEGLDIDIRVEAAIKAFNSQSADRMIGPLVEALPEESASKVLVKIDNVDSKLRIASSSVIDAAAVEEVLRVASNQFSKAQSSLKQKIDSGYFENQRGYYGGSSELSPYQTVQALTNIASYGGIRLEDSTRISEQIAGYIAVLEQHPHNSANNSYFARSYIAPLRELIEVLKLSVSDIKPIDPACSYETLVARAQEVAAVNASTSPLAIDILFHSESDVEIAKVIVGKLPATADRKQALTHLLSEGRYEFVADLLIENVLFAWLDDTVLGSALEPTEFVQVFLSRFFESNLDASNYQARWALSSVLGSRFLLPEIVKSLPVEALMLEGMTWTDERRAALTNTLTELLGDDDEAWSVFETLVNDGGLSLETAASTATLL